MKLNAFLCCSSENGSGLWLSLLATDTAIAAYQQVSSIGLDICMYYMLPVSTASQPSPSPHSRTQMYPS